ncbi:MULTISPECIES: LysR family transcriptional regulator [unclassified Sphingobacterium]|uniref:LysR family transcriptional regulator n=1 Tax=unclassified Sphingobacterium TaxID=2609468 RepID=UPI0010472E66|nr:MULTISPECIES: LysR family transcriptional regulator [unclassified Sphingobacterium]MCS3556166.1 DNA-binding transcriptional LysR family regulator [Sphingobacterium sp. JUb21]TCR08542.1 LysR family transcriptional regulator [Sphingobacterium sp. JUb20]
MISIANQIELRHLTYFKVLAEQLHYRKASESLFISQSALSQQIKQLEGILKVQLFDRTNRKVYLTDAGSLFKKDVQQILNKIETAVTNLKLLKMGNTGQIRIGFVASAMESILPDVLKLFHTDCPNIKFQIDELSNADQLLSLQNEMLDIGFMRSNHIPEGFSNKCVYIETFSLVLPIDHPITDKKFDTIAELADESFILFPNEKSQFYYQQIVNLCADHGFLPKVAHRSIHAPTIFRLVENGMGISIIPTSLAHTENPNIKFIELTGVPQKTALFAVWKKDNVNPALPYLLEMLPTA